MLIMAGFGFTIDSSRRLLPALRRIMSRFVSYVVFDTVAEAIYVP